MKKIELLRVIDAEMLELIIEDKLREEITVAGDIQGKI